MPNAWRKNQTKAKQAYSWYDHHLFGLCKRHQAYLPKQKQKIHGASQPVRNYVNIGKTGRTFRTVEVYEKNMLAFNSPRNIAGSVLKSVESFHAGFSLSTRQNLPMIWCSKFLLGNASLDFRGVTRVYG